MDVETTMQLPFQKTRLSSLGAQSTRKLQLSAHSGQVSAAESPFSAWTLIPTALKWHHIPLLLIEGHTGGQVLDRESWPRSGLQHVPSLGLQTHPAAWN